MDIFNYTKKILDKVHSYHYNLCYITLLRHNIIT
jgi:hypothetical protein